MCHLFILVAQTILVNILQSMSHGLQSVYIISVAYWLDYGVAEKFDLSVNYVK